MTEGRRRRESEKLEGERGGDRQRLREGKRVRRHGVRK